MVIRAVAIVIALLAGVARGDEAVVEVARFAEGDRSGWQAQRFQGETEYTFETVDGRLGLRASSDGTASGLVRRLTVDLTRTPYLEWWWRVQDVPEGVDERSRSGDDYAARVYVIVSGGLAFWRTRSLVYVWSSNQPIGSTWDNAFTSNARVMALRSGDRDAGRWVLERRNLVADFRQLFGDGIAEIDAVAIMTDTDNSGQSATAWYGDVTFVAE
ncbi:MAG: DUF3047 domain-containing protein [Pseudomonadales bacterium]